MRKSSFSKHGAQAVWKKNEAKESEQEHPRELRKRESDSWGRFNQGQNPNMHSQKPD